MPISRASGRHGVKLSQCPAFWSFKLHGHIATSTTVFKFFALSTAMRAVLPLRKLRITLSPSIGVHNNHHTSFQATIREDNAGALTLANLEPGSITPQSRHYVVTLHRFKSKLDPAGNHSITMSTKCSSRQFENCYIFSTILFPSGSTLERECQGLSTCSSMTVDLTVSRSVIDSKTAKSSLIIISQHLFHHHLSSHTFSHLSIILHVLATIYLSI
jgi:hypothetical protein